ncbi:hypothetical protein PC110_g17561 [Phytophthora cactorum]|nr:hypothetical protein PC123_g26270 [Phytophthora cactorum]RAW22662.1 hypothetical protein PC110_g20899 [Phytophthora cactorum]RAW23760.1 hypothetical protein PC110_g19816 [Phytophthora cactorum]RAW26045.1 hypothetical protein PC110_g17561 [Phytophthora cactorum]
MLNKPQFATWVKNVDELSATRPDTKISTISTLKAYYGDEALSQMIIAAQKNPKTQQLADELQTRQLQYWLDNKKTPADVFKLLELSKAGDNLLDNPQVSTWLSYVADFKKKTPRKSQESIPILTTHYGDEALSKILLEAKQTPSTATIADKLHQEQIQHWLDAGKSPGDVFKFLHSTRQATNCSTTRSLQRGYPMWTISIGKIRGYREFRSWRDTMATRR